MKNYTEKKNRNNFSIFLIRIHIITLNFQHQILNISFSFTVFVAKLIKKSVVDGWFKKEIKFDWNQLRLASEI